MVLKSSRFLAEMQRFELWRRFEPTYCISSADPSTTWVHLQICLNSDLTEKKLSKLLNFVRKMLEMARKTAR